MQYYRVRSSARLGVELQLWSRCRSTIALRRPRKRRTCIHILTRCISYRLILRPGCRREVLRLNIKTNNEFAADVKICVAPWRKYFWSYSIIELFSNVVYTSKTIANGSTWSPSRACNEGIGEGSRSPRAIFSFHRFNSNDEIISLISRWITRFGKQLPRRS